jgi:DNA polymerase
LDLSETGAWRYAAEPNTGVWCVAYAVDDGPVQLWIPGQPIPEEFHIAANDPTWLIGAHNAQFESSIENRILAPRYGWPLVPIDRHRCTMAMASASALPAKLKTVAEVLELSARKDDDGSRLMKEMARPRKPRAGEDPNGIYWHDEPEKLERLYAYCRQDVEVERELYHRVPLLTDAEQTLWVLDQQINQRGFYTDGPLLEAASKIAAEAGQATQDELARITGGELTSTDQVAATLEWLGEHGCEVKDLRKPTLGHALRRKDLDPICRRVIELRIGAAHASAAKIDSLLAWRDSDGRVRGTLRFHGAGTGRWTGSGPQPQNFKRDAEGTDAKRAAIATGDLGHVQKIYPQPLEVVGDIARAMICAAPGHRFLIGDFSGVESRVLAWVSGQQSKLDMWSKFDQTGDPKDEPYYLLGRGCGRPEDSARAIGKTADLAFGYMGGPGAWDRLAPDDDASTDDDKKRYQKAWRRMHPQTEKFWGGINRAAIQAVRKANVEFTCRKLTFVYDGEFLRITLPSGRSLSYPSPRLSTGKYGDTIVIFKDSTGGKWVDCRFGQGAYGGLWAENIVQAVSRDLLAEAMQRLETAGYSIVLHVHDEIVAEAPDGFGSVEDFTRLITALPAWAEGLPVAAKVRNGPRFAKAENKTASPHAFTATAPVNGAAVDDEDDVAQRNSSMNSTTPPWEDDPVFDLPIIDLPISISAILAPRLVPDVPRANGHDREYSDGSRAEAERDTHAEDNAGKPFDDAYLRRQGYRLTHKFDFPLPDGTVLYQQNRYELRDGLTPTSKRPKKKFLPHRGDVFGAGDRRVIYNWPAVMRAGPGSTVIVTEGEKNALALIKAGLLATTVLSHKWTPECGAALTGYHVIILEDHDDDGRKQSAIAHKTLSGVAASIRIVPTAHLWKHLPSGSRDIKAKDDVENWIELGGDPAKLLEICREIPVDGGELDEWDAGDLLSQGAQPPPRQWLYGWQLCRGFSSSLVAPGDHGKTTMRLTQAVELATGRELLGHRIYQRCRVLVLCLEDDQNELWRRLLAVCLHHDVDPAELRGWLFCTNYTGAKIAEEINGRRVLGKLEPMLRKAIERRQPDAVILDPFVKLHALDENDNPDMEFVVSQLVKLAQEYNIAIDSPAHTRKGALTAGDSDNRRGASAQRDAARLDYTLTAMSEAEAKQFGIDADERKSYVRLDRAKANIVRAIKASWYQLVSVSLGNVTDLYPEGDAVQAIETWVPPDPLGDLDSGCINRILDKIDAGMPDGNRYSGAASATKRAAWPIIIAEMPEMVEAQAREVIKDWLGRGVLISREYKKPGDGRKIEGLCVDPAKRPA